MKPSVERGKGTTSGATRAPGRGRGRGRVATVVMQPAGTRDLPLAAATPGPIPGEPKARIVRPLRSTA